MIGTVKIGELAHGLVSRVMITTIRSLVRLFIFLVFGPSLGLLTFFVVGNRSGHCTGCPDPSLHGFMFLLFLVYLNGLVPALATALVDSYFDFMGAKGILKWLATGLFGFLAAYLNVLFPLLIFQLKWGFVGAIPAVICSAITDQTMISFRKWLRA